MGGHAEPFHQGPRPSTRDCISASQLERRSLGLTAEERYRVADDAIKEMRRHGRFRDLDYEIDPGPGETTPRRP